MFKLWVLNSAVKNWTERFEVCISYCISAGSELFVKWKYGERENMLERGDNGWREYTGEQVQV
jgi:hypothetical protein